MILLCHTSVGLVIPLSGARELPSKNTTAGYKATAANLLSVLVCVWSCIVTVYVGFLGDHFGKRAYINL